MKNKTVFACVLATGALVESAVAEVAVTNAPLATNAAAYVPYQRPPRIESRAFDLVYASANEVSDVINTTWRGNASPAWGVLDNVGMSSAQATLTYNRRSGDDHEVATLTKFGDSTTKTTSVDQNENAVFSGIVSSTTMSFILSALEGNEDVKVFQNPKVIVTSGNSRDVPEVKS